MTKSKGVIESMVARHLKKHPCNSELVTVPELVSEVHFKIFRSIHHYHPDRGRAFSFLTVLTSNHLTSYRQVCYGRTHRQRMLREDIVDNSLSTESRDARDAIEDIMVRLYAILTTPLTLRNELAVSRWYVDSFFDCGFELKRNEYAEAARQVYGIPIERARQIYDLTMLTVRRALYDPSRMPSIKAEDLTATRNNPWPNYGKLLTPEELKKLISITRGIAPYTLYVIKPENEKDIRKGKKKVLWESLQLILNGSPNDQQLFDA